MKIIPKKQITINPNSQSGLSLIETMVSMVIGIFLLGGVITNFIGTKSSDKTRAAISEMDADAQTALSIMRQTIMHTGYPSMYNVLLDKPFYTKADYPLTANPTCGDGATARDEAPPAKKQITRDRWRGDVITVISLADNPCNAGQASCPDSVNVNPDALVYTDCVGGGATRDNRTVSCSADPDNGMKDPTQAKIYSTFRLGGGNDKRTLYCDGSRGTTQPLVDNIEAMQFLYGVRQDDGTTAYRRANIVENNSQWGLVNSVQVALLMRSSKRILDKDSDKTRYTLLDKAWNINTGDLKHLFRVYTTTINLENKNEGALL